MQFMFAGGRLALAAILAGSLALAGCKGNELSKQEVKQMQSGPPAQMPPEAQAAMQRGMQSPPGPPQQAPR